MLPKASPQACPFLYLREPSQVSIQRRKLGMIQEWCRLLDKGWLTQVLKQPVNHKSWLTGFRSFVRIPSTIPTGTSRLDIWIFGYLDYGNQFVAASPIRTSVWCSPAGGFFFQKKHAPGVFATCNCVSCILLRRYSMGLG